VGKVAAFASDNVPATTVLSIAVAAAMLPAAPLRVAFGLLAPALFSPAIAKWAIDKKVLRVGRWRVCKPCCNAGS
jgi:hypothetical protein